jgi:hypothetical protein
MPGRFRFIMGVVLGIVVVVFYLAGLTGAQEPPGVPGLSQELSPYAGSKSCIGCHGKFYQLWATSRHGLAMQPYTPQFAQAHMTPPTKDLVIGKYRYREIRPGPPCCKN